MAGAFFIYGAGDLGRQVEWLAARSGLVLSGFIDDNADISDIGPTPVFSFSDFASQQSGKGACSVFLAISDPSTRLEVAKKLSAFDWISFPSIVDRDAVIAPSVFIGKGVIVFPGAIIDVSAHIGSFAIINKLCSIGHDVRLSDFVTLSPMVMIGGRVSILPRCFLGASSAIRQGLQIAEGSMIGMGAVVVKEISLPGVYIGNPAKPLSRK